MKTSSVRFASLGVLSLVALIVAFVVIKPALAQVATSSPADATSSPTTPMLDASASTTPPAPEVLGAATNTSAPVPASSTTPANTASTAPSSPATEQPPSDLTLVHIIGTKCTDYFTDGTTVTAYPGDPAIDSNFDKPNAPIPTHQGLTWGHTTGGYLYDTPGGDLEVGDYAVQPSGNYIAKAPPFVSSTSTAPTSSSPSSSSTTSSTDTSPAVLGA